jgi:hypothetical protein
MVNLIINPYFYNMFNLRELVKNLKGLEPRERYFRVLVSYLIKTGEIKLLYREHTFSRYLIMMGEDQDSEQFNFLMKRRDEYMVTVERLIMNQLMVIQ